MSFTANDRVSVVGPNTSAQRGKSGRVVQVNQLEKFTTRREMRAGRPVAINHAIQVPNVEVQLDGEDRPRNFDPKNLTKE